MNNITKIILAVIAAVVIYFVLIKGPEQTNSTQRAASGDSPSRRPSIFNTKDSDDTPSNTPTGTRPTTPGNMNERETDSKTTSRNGRFTTISLRERGDRNITDSADTTTTSSSTSGSRTQGTSTRGNSTTGTRTTSSTTTSRTGNGTNSRRSSPQYYPLH